MYENSMILYKDAMGNFNGSIVRCYGEYQFLYLDVMGNSSGSIFRCYVGIPMVLY